MITATNLVEILAHLRCFKYYVAHIDMWMAFESMTEEGEGVKKSLGRFETEEEADEFLEAYRAKLKEHIASLIIVVDGATESRLPAPLVKEVRKGKQPKLRKKKDATPPTDAAPAASDSGRDRLPPGTPGGFMVREQQGLRGDVGNLPPRMGGEAHGASVDDDHRPQE